MVLLNGTQEVEIYKQWHIELDQHIKCTKIAQYVYQQTKNTVQYNT